MAGHQDHNISGRHVDNGSIKGAAYHSNKCNDQVASVAGVCGKFREIPSGSETDNPISQFPDRFSKDDDQPSTGESAADHSGLQVGFAADKSLGKGSILTDREDDSHHASSITCTPLLQNLQRLKNTTFSHSQSYVTSVSLDYSARNELVWWKTQMQSRNGKAMISPIPDIVMETDASLLRWGAVSDGVRTNDLWSERERTLHINHPELMAGAFVVKAFARQQRDVHLHLKMDNKTAVCYINKMGVTRSAVLSHSTCLLWQWCLQRGVTLSAEYLLGKSNVIADQESRLLLSSAEWMLNQKCSTG